MPRGRVQEVLLGILLVVFGVVLARGVSQSVPFLARLDLDLSPVAEAPLTTPVAVIEVRSSTQESLGIERPEPMLPRSVHARLLDRLRRAGAKVVVFDFAFTQPSQEDDQLRDAIGRAAPTAVVLGAEAKDFVRDPSAPGGIRYRFALPTVAPFLVDDGLLIGSLVAWDPDLVLRGVVLAYQDAQPDGPAYPHITVAALAAAEGLSGDDLRYEPDARAWALGPHRWPVGADFEYRTRWLKEPADLPVYEYTEAYRALETAEGRESFRGKIVIVSSIVDGQRANDIHVTEVGDLPGAHFLAHVVNSLAQPNERQVRPGSVASATLFAVLLATLGGLAAGRLRLLDTVLGIAVILALAFVVPRILLESASVRVEQTFPALAGILCLGTTGAVNGLRSRLRAERWMPSYVREQRAFGGTEIVTVMFIDLRGSTETASAIGLEGTRTMLHEVLQVLVDTVRQAGGDVERTLGDGVMAMWRLAKHPDHADRAVGCAFDLHRAVQALAPAFVQRYGRAPTLTIGLESGEISGDLVSAAGHEEWSSFGITIHIAARYQSKCGELNLPLVFGEGTHRALSQPEKCVSLPPMHLKGIGDAVGYTILQL